MGFRSVEPVFGDVAEYPALAGDENNPVVVLADPEGFKLLTGYPEPLGICPPDRTPEVEGDPNDDPELRSLPVSGEVRTPLGPLAVGRSDGPAKLLPVGSPSGYDDEPSEGADNWPVPGGP